MELMWLKSLIVLGLGYLDFCFDPTRLQLQIEDEGGHPSSLLPILPNIVWDRKNLSDFDLLQDEGWCKMLKTLVFQKVGDAIRGKMTATDE